MSMTVKFQRKVLRFLYRAENKRYVHLVDDKCFDTAELKLGYEVLRAYVKEFGAVPDAISAVEYFHRSAEEKQMDPNVQTRMAAYIEGMYERRDEDTGLVVKTILDYAARKKGSELIKTWLPKMKEGGLDTMKQFAGEVSKVSRLDQTILELESNKGGFLLADHAKEVNLVVQGHPTFLKGWNRMTAAGGFKTPELVILLSGPKGYKTGLAISTALEYVREGLKVYYVDCENGKNNIKTRARQYLMECERYMLTRAETLKNLGKVVDRIKPLGGDLVVDFYPANSCTVSDVEQNIRELWEQYGWRPDLIVYDYPDLLKPIEHKRERRHEISAVYFDIINLNARLGCFALGVSQVNRNAVDKPVLTLSDFSEDFGKAMNCHAAFALCRTPEEVEAGIGRLVPVVQREGARYRHDAVCFVRIKEATMQLDEITAEEATDMLRMVEPKDKGKGRGRGRGGRSVPLSGLPSPSRHIPRSSDKFKRLKDD